MGLDKAASRSSASSSSKKSTGPGSSMSSLDLAGFVLSFAAITRAFDDDVVRIAEKAVVVGPEDVPALERFLSFALST
jgi:hypothetical protein